MPNFGTFELILGLLTLVLGPGGAAFVGIKFGINGIRTDVKEIKKEVSELRDSLQHVEKDIAFMEGRQKGS